MAYSRSSQVVIGKIVRWFEDLCFSFRMNSRSHNRSLANAGRNQPVHASQHVCSPRQSIAAQNPERKCFACLCDQLNDTTSLGNLALSLLAEPPGAHNQWNLGESTLAENLAVSEREEIENGDDVLLAGGQVLVALLSGDEGPEL